MTQAKKVSLQAYAAQLKRRLEGSVPEGQNPEAFRQMLEIDLKKTLAKLTKEG